MHTPQKRTSDHFGQLVPPGPAPAPVLAAAATAGLGAALALPPSLSPGVGWPVAVLVAAAGLWWAAGRLALPRPSWSRLGWAVAVLALVSVGAVRAAEWLSALCLVTAWGAGAVAVTTGRSGRAILTGVVEVTVAVLRSPAWGGRGLAVLVGRTGDGAVRLVWSLVAGVVLLLVFGLLFATADPAYARLVADALPALDGPELVRLVLVTAVAAVTVLGVCHRLLAPRHREPVAPAAATLRRAEWAVPVAMLVALFVSFVLVQLAALFGGSAYVRTTTGLSYAEYARQGFWQLSAVTALTLGVIAAAARWAPAATRADRVWLRALLGPLAGLTLLVVASALGRMWTYQEAYGFTVLRLLVSCCELWLGLVYLLVLLAGVRLRARWLPKAVLASGVTALLVLAAANPDRLVADANVDRYRGTGQLDLAYLSGLSADAVPAMERLPEPARGCALASVAAWRSVRVGDWRSWNLGWSGGGVVVRRPADCPYEIRDGGRAVLR